MIGCGVTWYEGKERDELIWYAVISVCERDI